MSKGRVTIPTDANFVEGTKRIAALWGADAVRDCDGTELPENAAELAEKVYKTYFLARGDNAWAKAHPEFLQCAALSSEVVLAESETVVIDLMQDFFPEQIAVNDEPESVARWQVFNRTAGKEVGDWTYDKATHSVIIRNATAMDEYSVNFFGRNLWDAVQIYNYITNGWTCEKDRDLDPVYPEVRELFERNLRKWLKDNPQVSVVRFTTFFYNFFLIHRKNVSQTKYFDWYGYAMTASPETFRLFEEENGYAVTLEDIVSAGYYSNNFRLPSKKYLAYCDFIERKVTEYAKKYVDIVHENGREAMMFWGDNWIGAEPYGKYFKEIGLDAVVGSVNSGWTIRLLSDVPDVKYREARLLPYFFPDTLNDDEAGTKYLIENWVTGRRAIMRSPVDRIGFGGYLSLAAKFPKFVDTAAKICEEFREIYDMIDHKKPWSLARVAVLTEWGKRRSWMMDSVCMDAYFQKVQNYQGIPEILSGLPVEISFIDFNDVLNGELDKYDVVMNFGVGGNAFSGGENWKNATVLEKIRAFVYNGGGFIGVGEPSACERCGRYFQLSGLLGVDREMSFTLSRNKFNFRKADGHFITEDVKGEIDYGNIIPDVYALEGATVLDIIPDKTWGVNVNKGHVTMAVNEFGKGRSFYISGIRYNPSNSRLLYRAIAWCTHRENAVKQAFSENINTECHYYPESKKYAVINNGDAEQSTVFYDINGNRRELTLQPYEMRLITTD